MIPTIAAIDSPGEIGGLIGAKDGDGPTGGGTGTFDLLNIKTMIIITIIIIIKITKNIVPLDHPMLMNLLSL